MHIASRVVLLAAIALGLPAWSAKHHSRSHQCTIVAFGDSITWGAYASINRVPFTTSVTPIAEHLVDSADTSYPGDLQRLVHHTVCNYGVPGEVTGAGRARLHVLLQKLQPRYLLLMEGVNDLGSDPAVDEALADLHAMVREASSAHVHTVLLTLTPTYFPKGNPHHAVNAEVMALNRSIHKLAIHLHVPLADVERTFRHDRHGALLTRHYDGVDYLHPNDAGYRLIAETVARALRR